jgi:hypothetical protein
MHDYFFIRKTYIRGSRGANFVLVRLAVRVIQPVKVAVFSAVRQRRAFGSSAITAGAMNPGVGANDQGMSGGQNGMLRMFTTKAVTEIAFGRGVIADHRVTGLFRVIRAGLLEHFSTR